MDCIRSQSIQVQFNESNNAKIRYKVALLQLESKIDNERDKYTRGELTYPFEDILKLEDAFKVKFLQNEKIDEAVRMLKELSDKGNNLATEIIKTLNSSRSRL